MTSEHLDSTQSDPMIESPLQKTHVESPEVLTDEEKVTLENLGYTAMCNFEIDRSIEYFERAGSKNGLLCLQGNLERNNRIGEYRERLKQAFENIQS